MALTNCSIDSKSVNVTKNNNLTGVANQVLTITPSTGYRVSASDFSQDTDLTTAPWVNQIQSITLANTGVAYASDNKVTVTVDLKDSFVAADNNTFTIDINGAAIDEKLATFTIAGTWDQVVNGNVTASPVTNASANAYTKTSVAGSAGIIISQNYVCASGYYFTAAPTFTKTTVGDYADNYTYIITPYAWDDGNLPTAYAVQVTVTVPEANVSGHNLDISANAVSAVTTQANLVTGYVTDRDSFSTDGDTNIVKIFGNAGSSAVLTLTRASDSHTYDFTSDTFTSGSTTSGNLTIPSNGIYEVEITIPSSADSKTYNFSLQGGTSPSTNTVQGGTGNNNAYTWSVLQIPDVSITLTASGTSLNVASGAAPASSVISGITASGSNYDDNGNLLAAGGKFHVVVTSSTAGKVLQLRRQPVFSNEVGYDTAGNNDFTNTLHASNNGMVWEVGSLTATGDNSTTVNITSSDTGYLWETGGTANVTSNLNLDNIINQAPVTLNKTFNGTEDNNLVIDLSANSGATDPEGDTLTYSIVADNTGGNGTLGSVNTSTGVVTFTPTANWNGTTNFTWKVNDGHEDSNTSTATITLAAVADAPTNITMSSQSINENNSVNDVIGAFSSTDPDGSGTYAYTLVSGTGDTDNASFNISGSNLRAGIVFDYETKNSYSIRVRSTDADGSGNFEKQFTISIGDVTEAATWKVEIYNAAGSGTGVIYYIDSTQYCNGTNLALMPGGCFGLNKFVRVVTKVGGCSSTDFGGAKIIDVNASGTASVYIKNSIWYSTAADSINSTGGTNC